MKKIIAIYILLFSVMAHASPGTTGDEHGPFPVGCIDFSGVWTSEDDQYFNISQKKCNSLKIKSLEDADNATQMIVPDNINRTISGVEWSGMVRHRWNSLSFGTSIETYRTMFFQDSKVQDVITLELVNENLLLESTFRVIIPNTGDKRKEYYQKVLQRVNTLRNEKPKKKP